MTTARLFHVDAFTAEPFSGNPAVVLVLDREPGDDFGARAGAEFSQPATALTWPAGEPGRFGLRWFTAAGELALCGHGTLAAARVLLDLGAGVGGRVRFDTKAGPLEAEAIGATEASRVTGVAIGAAGANRATGTTGAIRTDRTVGATETDRTTGATETDRTTGATETAGAAGAVGAGAVGAGAAGAGAAGAGAAGAGAAGAIRTDRTTGATETDRTTGATETAEAARAAGAGAAGAGAAGAGAAGAGAAGAIRTDRTAGATETDRTTGATETAEAAGAVGAGAVGAGAVGAGAVGAGAVGAGAVGAGAVGAGAVGGLVRLRFPALTAVPVADPALEAAIRGLLGVPADEVLRNNLDAMAVLGSAASVAGARPDLAALARLPLRGLIITAAGDGGEADFVSRFFSPATGIDEDAVTGSAHCALAPYWIARLGRQPLTGHQLSARGGRVQVAREGDSVTLAGPAVILAHGSWAGPLMIVKDRRRKTTTILHASTPAPTARST